MIFARIVGVGGENLVDVAHVVLLDDRRRVDPEIGQVTIYVRLSSCGNGLVVILVARHPGAAPSASLICSNCALRSGCREPSSILRLRWREKPSLISSLSTVS